LYFQIPRADFQAAAATLDQQIPQLSDQQIIVRLAELVALVGDAHTNIFLTQSQTGFRVLPIRVQWFDDGLFVIAALPGAERAVGKRVVRIGGVDIDEAYNRVVSTISAENDAWRRRRSQDYLVLPELLQVLGLTPDAGAAEFAFQDRTGATFELQLASYRTSDARSWIYWPDLTSEAVPLYRKQNNQNYWFQYLSESRTLYFKYNVCNEAPYLAFASFATEFLRAVDENPIDRFVIDVRNNTGGNSALIQPLLAALQQRYTAGTLSPSVKLSVIIGKETFSSGLLNALELKAAPVTTLVGEPTGGKPNHYGNVGSLVLPRSGLRLSYSTRFFSSPITTPSLDPDVRVPFTSSAFFENRDPFLDAALENQSTATSVGPFVMYLGGGSRIQSTGQSTTMRIGYATVSSSLDVPHSFGILQLRQQGVLISEATMTPSTPATSGITYAEVEGPVNTGVAIANPFSSEAIVNFEIRDDSGAMVATSELRLAPGAQLARFLTEPPFNVAKLAGGSLRMTSSLPVSVLALRGLSNERGEFLVSTLSFTESASSASAVYCAHTANGEGWTTQVNLVNSSNQTITGSVEFLPGDRFTYMLPPYGTRRFRTDGLGIVRSGFVRVTPDAGLPAPAATAVFSYRRNDVTVTEASVHGTVAALSQTMLVSGSGGFNVGSADAIMSGIGVANGIAEAVSAQVILTSLAGATLASTSIEIPANSQQALFLGELFAGTVTLPFEATLRITSNRPIAVTGLRGQYNSRGDFLISATPIFSQTPGTVFTHIVDGGGYSTRFLFISRNGSIGGNLRLSTPDGSPLAIELRD